MFVATCGEHVFTGSENILRMYHHNNLNSEIFRREYNSNISAVYSAPSFLLIGCFNGEIFLFNYENKKEFNILNFNCKVTCVFNQGIYYYFGSEEGKIVVYLINDTKEEKEKVYDEGENLPSSIFYDDSMSMDIHERNENTQTFYFKNIKQLHHNAPIIAIASLGELTYVLDVRGKITLYPENISYDIYANCMIFKKYLFAAENNLLFCRTNEAFANILTVKDKILEFIFSKNGGVLFVKTEKYILIYNKNLKLISKTKFNNGSFVFNEEKNILIFFDGNKIWIKNNVIEKTEYLNDKMIEFKFAENKINEKIIKMQEEEPDYEYKFKSDSHTKRTKIVEDNNMTHKYNYSDKSVRKHSNIERYCSSSEEMPYNNDLDLFEEDEISQENVEIKDNFHLTEKIFIKPFMSGYIKNDDVEMLCYNKIAYITKIDGFIEVNYHNNDIPKLEFRNNYIMGAVSEQGCVFVDDSNNLVYHGKNSWSKTIPDIKLIYINKKYIICVTSTEISIFKFSGIKILSSVINDPISICEEDDIFALICINKIYVFDPLLHAEIVDFNLIPTFCCIDKKIIYFAHDEILYCMKDKLYYKIMNIKNIPLCVKNQFLITFNGKIFPIPNIEFYKVNFDNYFINPLFDKEERENYIIEKIEFAKLSGDTILLEDLIDLLNEVKNKNYYQKYLKREYIDHIDDYNFSDDQTYPETINMKSEISELDFKIEEKENVIKPKRFNPFAKK